MGCGGEMIIIRCRSSKSARVACTMTVTSISWVVTGYRVRSSSTPRFGTEWLLWIDDEDPMGLVETRSRVQY